MYVHIQQVSPKVSYMHKVVRPTKTAFVGVWVLAGHATGPFEWDVNDLIGGWFQVGH